MKKSPVRFLPFVFLIYLIAGAYPATSADVKEKVFTAGAATSNITPPLGSPVAGAGSIVPTHNVHDELHARALVLDDGTTRIALVICDSSGVSKSICDQAREHIAATGLIPPENVMISATHTHSGPNANAKNYRDFLALRIADSVQRAISNLKPAKIGWGGVDDPSELFNRRWYVDEPALLKNPFGGMDKVRTNPPLGSKALLKPAGPIDPEISFVSVQSLDGNPIALLANYSLHYVGGVAKGEISADYFAVFARRIGELLGAKPEFPHFVGIMSNGTSGDVNNSDRRIKKPNLAAYEKINSVGEKIAQRVAEAHREIKFQDWVPLGASGRTLSLKVRKPDEEMLRYAREVMIHPEDTAKYPRYALKYAVYADRFSKGADETSALVQAFRIGDLGIAAIPFEVFTETGLHIKKESPFADTFTIELANGAGGYLPTPAQHKLGGYETWLGTCRVQLDASDIISRAVLSMMKELKAD